VPPSSADFETLLVNYAKLRPPDSRTPQQLLRSLDGEITTVVLPCLESLENRSQDALYALNRIVRHAGNDEIARLRPIDNAFKHAKKTAKQIGKETDDISERLSQLPPGSLQRKQLVEAVEVRRAELDLAERHIESYQAEYDASISKMTELMPSIEDTQSRIKKLNSRFNTTALSIAFFGLVTVGVRALPTVIAFFTTIVLDMFAHKLEGLVKVLRPSDYHDLVLILIFGIQVLLLTPLISTVSNRLCWQAFDNRMRRINSILPDVKAVENEVAQIENRLVIMSKIS
jgi:hypothetical protein